MKNKDVVWVEDDKPEFWRRLFAAHALTGTIQGSHYHDPIGRAVEYANDLCRALGVEIEEEKGGDSCPGGDGS